jgi:hypothetical protein
MMSGEADVVSGWKTKVQTTMANVVATEVLAEQHRKQAEPGGAKKRSLARTNNSQSRRHDVATTTKPLQPESFVHVRVFGTS